MVWLLFGEKIVVILLLKSHLKNLRQYSPEKNGDGTTFGAITKDELFGLAGTEMRSLRWGNDADLRKKERSALSLLPFVAKTPKGQMLNARYTNFLQEKLRRS